MENEYLKNLNKIEFVLTYSCTGSCKHCSQGDHKLSKEHMDAYVAADAVRKVAAKYDIKTVMVFGGEPLLDLISVYTILKAATEMNVPRRQVITNGFFATGKETIKDIVEVLSSCGVNDLLLSVDAFHQETIPLGVVLDFASEAVRRGIPIRLNPAWLVSAEDDNPYNVETRRILHCFDELGIPTGEGNVVFPEGNARRYLAEYFVDSAPENPYVDDAKDVRCLSFSPNGDVLNGNVYENDILKIIKKYNP